MTLNTTHTKAIGTREDRGKIIATTKKIRYDEERHIYLVPSQSSDKVYYVDEKLECNCPDALTHKATCKHSHAVRYYLQVEKGNYSKAEITNIPLTYQVKVGVVRYGGRCFCISSLTKRISWHIITREAMLKAFST